jgi:protein TonB
LLPYQLPSPQHRTPLHRRASGLALALGVNLLLLFVLLGIGVIPLPKPKVGHVLSVDLIPESHSSAPQAAETARTHTQARERPVPKPPPIVLPAKPTIAQPHTSPWIEMSKEDMAAADITKLPKSGSGSGSEDSEEVGRGPNGEVLYAAEWARHPTDAELAGYLPANAQDGYGLIACKTIPGNRVEDCIELDQYPHGSHLASAVRQAAWQFRVRPPRKNGRPLVGSWVQIRIEYERIGAVRGL